MRSQFDDNGGRPDVTEIFGHATDTLRKHIGKLGPLLLVLLVVIIGFWGTFQVEPGEISVIRTFGREDGKRGPGLHFAFPLIQSHDEVNIEQVRRIEVGFRGDQRIPIEALMLTGDENIVEAQMVVQFRVRDPSKWLFELKDPELALRSTAEVALRSMVGRTNIDDVITTGRETVQDSTRSWLQTLMNSYQSGLEVTEVRLQAVDAPDEVKEAFHDVVRAREEKEKLINQARGYNADIIPRARGEARRIEREAEGYREKRIVEARGDASRFVSVFAEYAKAREVTRRRLYLETMERVLGGIENKVLVDHEVAKNALPLLPIGRQGVAAAGGGK
jgi:membrane protease subunit HflK